METEQAKPVLTAIPEKDAGRFLPIPRLSTILAVVVIVFLIYAFLSGLTFQFYASILFLAYSITHSMWISVICLGVFQTFLLVPFRIVNLLKSAHIKEFREKITQLKADKDREYLLKQSVRGGRRVALFYIVNFFVQTISYVSIGRLFLTDFYSERISPDKLYSFVPYPDYPLQDRFFKIPYPWFSETQDWGMRSVLIAWGIIILGQILVNVLRYVWVKWGVKADHITQSPVAKRFLKYSTGYTVLFLFLAWILMRHFPIGWEIRIFSGDVSLPNPRFNTITAIVTFLTLIWINLPKISKKGELAEAAGIDQKVIEATQKDMLKETLKVATVVGLGAYYITSQIPSAFELSIFTLEMISLLAPLTLDRVILGTVKLKQGEKKEEEKMTSVKPTVEEAEKELSSLEIE